MARPLIPVISSGLAGWDATIDDIHLTLTAKPYPSAFVADVATLYIDFPPGLYEDCTVVVQSPRGIYTSDGTNWIPA